MEIISPEHGAALLNIAAAHGLELLGSRTCRYVLLTPPNNDHAEGSHLPNVELGVVRYVDADGNTISPGKLTPLEPAQTEHGRISYKEMAEEIKFRPSNVNAVRWNMRMRKFRDLLSAEEHIGALAATIRTRPDLPISAAWSEGLDFDLRRLYAQFHLPEGTTPERMKTLMVLQGHEFNDAGELIVDSPYVAPYSDWRYIVHYTFNSPPSKLGELSGDE